jgi:hypothetical protein
MLKIKTPKNTDSDSETEYFDAKDSYPEQDSCLYASLVALLGCLNDCCQALKAAIHDD